MNVITSQISDNPCKTAVVMAALEAEQWDRECTEQQQLELQRKQREEQRLEEARQREQRALEQLQRQQQVFLHVTSAFVCNYSNYSPNYSPSGTLLSSRSSSSQHDLALTNTR